MKVINLPKFLDKRGNLSFLQENGDIPFKIERIYWLYDVPGGESRGGHAYHKLEEIIIALSGSFDVIVNDGNKEFKFHLNRSYYGLYIPNLIWRKIENFSTNSFALIIANLPFNEEDYIRDFDKFKKLLNENKKFSF